ncbi:MAG: Pantothenate synthetase, partial [Candidatus Peregrinibacteria bacterium GW2011_GWA2_44_7]
LFEHVQPTDVYFGQKDYQQTRVIDWLIQAYFPSIRLHVEPTVREQNGLALSSRNSYLSSEERHVAPQLHDSLQKVRSYFGEGVRRSAVLLDLFRASLSSPLFSSIYAEIRDCEDLTSLESVNRPAVLAVAVHLGKTRLIDNVFLE